ncbi:MAG: hypothetical protein BGO41_01020 [Clostridiales bacterium 38-18]|nr:MAG: hypothetical protein BGO41_01020 [Clostridiales bacterium 38-18]
MTYRAVIIDDEAWTREVIKSLGRWEALDIEIVGEASDGDFGIELIRQLKPEIVITDINMPKKSGLELIRSIRATGSTAKVIIISGYDDFEYIHTALKLGVSDYLLKPIKPDELNKQLELCVISLDEASSRNKLQLEGGLQFELSSYEFMAATWAEAFNQHKAAAYEALYSDDEEVLDSVFNKIQRLFDQQDKADKGLSNKSDLIFIFYTLMSQLKIFISENEFKINDIFNTNECAFVFSQECTSDEMLYFIKSLYIKTAQSVKWLRLNRNKLDIGKIKHYIDENYQNQITLEQTATRFYISPTYLSKCFKNAYEEGFNEYLNSVRLEKAKQLILEKKLPLKEVGYLVGYVEQAHFYKKFKKYFGVTPGEMRESIKMNNESEQE